jgi:quercetin dioxygenase-like cupin family protein
MNMTDQHTGTPQSRWFLGTAIKILVSASEGNDDICVVEHRMAQGEASPLHLHRNEDEILVLLEGRLRIDIAGQTRRIEAGQAAAAPKCIPHAFLVESETARLLTVTRGHDFETMLRTASRPAAGPGLPPRIAPTPEMVAALDDTCRRHNIDLVGPPIG